MSDVPSCASARTLQEIPCAPIHPWSSMMRPMRLTAKMLSVRKPGFRQGWALVSLVLFFALQIFAGSESLHRAIHHDADLPSHHCVITLLSHGQVAAPTVPGIFVAFCAALIFLLPLFESAVLSFLDYRLSPSRAPPRF